MNNPTEVKCFKLTGNLQTQQSLLAGISSFLGLMAGWALTTFL